MRRKGSILIHKRYQIWAYPFRIKVIRKSDQNAWSEKGSNISYKDLPKYLLKWPLPGLNQRRTNIHDYETIVLTTRPREAVGRSGEIIVCIHFRLSLLESQDQIWDKKDHFWSEHSIKYELILSGSKWSRNTDQNFDPEIRSIMILVNLIHLFIHQYVISVSVIG